MVLERLVSLRTAIKQPVWMFLIGGIVSIVSLFIADFVFQTSIGTFTSLLITITLTPLSLNLFRYDEEKEEQEKNLDDMNFIQRILFHREILLVYVAFFAGMILVFSIIYLLLPDAISQKLFSDQINQINAIRGKFLFADTFVNIIKNNISVLLLSFLFSFVFGAGAIFILSWNASVLATAIGMIAKPYGVVGLPIGIGTYIFHGSLEILAYFIAAIAGGLISTAIIRRRSGKFWIVFKDSLQLIAISAVILVAAGLLESFLYVV
jgi:uncharacterized membrane protein SpoIIM required for sporulation